MKNFLIDGIWQGPPDGFDVKEWLNEVVAYSVLTNTFNLLELFVGFRR